MADNFRDSEADEYARTYDPYAHAFTTIQEEHRLIHDGMGFQITHYVASLAASGSAELLVAVPAGTFPHFRKYTTTATGGPVRMRVYEGTTTSDDGTGITSFNLNRNSTRSASTVITHTPTISADGTLIETLLHPTPTAIGANVGGVTGPDVGEEWVAKPSTKYLYRVTNDSAGAVAVCVYAFWYEIGYLV